MQKHTNKTDTSRESALSLATVQIRCARSISTILSPAAVSIPVVVLIAFYHTSTLLLALGYAGLTLFFLSFGPLMYVLVGVRLGKLSDLDVSRRTERTGPFLFGLLSVVLGLFVLTFIHAPKDLITVMITTAVSGVIIAVITWRWKISIHAATLASSLTMLTALYGAVMLPMFALLVLVNWSRVLLRSHTVAQVIAGSLVSMILTAAMLLLRGW